MAITYSAPNIVLTNGADYGTATGGSSTTLVDSGKAWTANAWVGRLVWIKAGTRKHSVGLITSNSATAITCSGGFYRFNPTTKSVEAVTLAAGDTYAICYTMADIIAAQPTYAAWRYTNRHAVVSAGISLTTAAALQGIDEVWEFSGDRQGVSSAAGTFWQMGQMHSAEFPYDALKSGAVLVRQASTSGYWEVVQLGKCRFYGTLIRQHRMIADGLNNYTRWNMPGGSADGLEFYNSIVDSISLQFSSGKDIAVRTIASRDGSFGIDSSPLLFAGNRSPAAFRPASGSELGARGADIIDHVYPGQMFLFLYTLANKGVGYMWNPTFYTTAWTSGFNWYSTPSDGHVYRGYLVGLEVKDAAGAAVSGASVYVAKTSDGSGAILTGKNANYTPITGSVVSTDADGKYVGVVGSGEGLPVLYARYTKSSQFVSIETLYGPYTFRLRKYGYRFVSRPTNWTERSKEAVTLDTNAYVAASEATAGAYTGTTINGSAKTIALSGARSLQELYDYSQAWASTSGNMGYDEPITTADGSNFTLASGWVISGLGYLAFGGKRLSGFITLAAAGAYSPVLGTATLTFSSAGTYDLGDASLGGTITLVNTSGGAVTVQIPAGVTYVNSGPSITVMEPTVSRGLAFTGLLAGSDVRVFETGTQTVIDSIASSGTSWTWDEETTGSITVDYTILKDGYAPIRVTGVTVTAAVSSGVLAVGVQQTAIRAYVPSSGLTFGSTLTVTPGTKRLALTTPSTGQNAYSALLEYWRTQPTLANVAFPAVNNGPASFGLTDGWEYTPGSIAYLSRDGLRYTSSAGAVTATWAALLSSGVPAGMTVRYEQSDGGTVQSSASTGEIDQLIQVYGDATHGNFDRTSWLVLKVQGPSYDEASSDAVATYGTLEDQLYVVGLSPIANGVDDAAITTGVTITDHGASPVTWEGLAFSITITSDRPGAEILQYLRHSPGFDLHDLVRTNGALFKTVRGPVYGDVGATLKGARVLTTGGSAHPDFDLMTADSGATWAAPTYQSVAISGGVAGSILQLFDTTAGEELYCDVPASWPLTWTDPAPYSADRAVRIRCMFMDGTDAKLFLESNIGTCTEASPALGYLIAQEDDAVYTANGIDGSAVTGITIDDSLLRVLISRTSITWAEIYAYETFWLSTVAGIRDEARFVTAIDQANYVFEGFQIRNEGTLPLVITGGYGRDKATGTSLALIDTTGAPIFLAPDHVVNNIVTISGANVITGDIADIVFPEVPTPTENAAAVLSAAQAAPIHADVLMVRSGPLKGDGTEANPWGPA